uniref:Uncharacterized protein n=1 Tax=Aegilops tauschii subsp. strangulata TaxID=200361 RepID=A0A453FQK3_AEGTS
LGQEEPGVSDAPITSEGEFGEGDSELPINFDAEAGAVAVSAEPPADASLEDLENIREIKRVRPACLASSFSPGLHYRDEFLFTWYIGWM